VIVSRLLKSKGENMVDTVIVENEAAPAPALSWASIIAGAVVSLALSLILVAVGAGLGLSAAPWATDHAITTTKAATVAGIYLTVTAVMASALGGYIAGRFRTLWRGIHTDEVFFRDTAHGVIAWALATVAVAALIGSSAVGIASGAAHGVATQARDRSAGYMDRLFDYDYDTLQKNQGNQTIPGISRDWNGDRAAADRLLIAESAPGHTTTPAEHARLVAIVAARTGLSVPDADKRVTEVEADARATAERARHVSSMLAFWFAASLLAGALAAGLAAWEGGAIRDGRLS
jgi:hypothetical protein